jgi:hypothetical protein
MSTITNAMLGGGAPVQPVKPNNSFNPPGATLPGPVTDTQAKSWYEAMAKAWGNVLDQQAGKITELSDQIGNGGQDQPSTVTLLTAESLKMQFLATNSSTSNNSVGQALDALARKQ